MKITAKIGYYPETGSVLALASVGLDDEFCISGVRLVDGSMGHFISMPSRKDKQGEYHDVCYPLSKELRQQILEAVEAVYDEGCAADAEPAPAPKAKPAARPTPRRGR